MLSVGSFGFEDIDPPVSLGVCLFSGAGQSYPWTTANTLISHQILFLPRVVGALACVCLSWEIKNTLNSWFFFFLFIDQVEDPSKATKERKGSSLSCLLFSVLWWKILVAIE